MVIAKLGGPSFWRAGVVQLSVNILDDKERTTD